MTHFRGRSVRSSSRRQVTWIGPADQNYFAVANGSNNILGSFDPAGAGFEKPTITRIRGQVSVGPQAGGADLDIVGAWGMAIVSDQAFAAGQASIPGPFDEASWDGWFAHGFFSMKLDVTTDVGRLLIDRVQEIDSKGQRKVSDGETIVIMCESNLGAFDISLQQRMLLKLA